MNYTEENNRIEFSVFNFEILTKTGKEKSTRISKDTLLKVSQLSNSSKFNFDKIGAYKTYLLTVSYTSEYVQKGKPVQKRCIYVHGEDGYKKGMHFVTLILP